MKIQSTINSEYYFDTDELGLLLSSLQLSLDKTPYMPVLQQDSVFGASGSYTLSYRMSDNNNTIILSLLSKYCPQSSSNVAIQSSEFADALYHAYTNNHDILSSPQLFSGYISLMRNFMVSNNILATNISYDCKGYIYNSEHQLIGTFNSICFGKKQASGIKEFNYFLHFNDVVLNDKANGFCISLNGCVAVDKRQLFNDIDPQFKIYCIIGNKFIEVNYVSKYDILPSAYADENYLEQDHIFDINTNVASLIRDIVLPEYDFISIKDLDAADVSAYAKKQRQFIVSQNSQQTENKQFDFLL